MRACKTLVAERGVPRATVADVARKADITPGLVHYYFPSKQALVHALFDSLVADFGARLETVDGPEAVLRGFVDRALALGDDADPEGVRAWVWLSAEALHDEGLAERWQAQATVWLDQLTNAFDQVGADDAAGLAGAVLSGVLGAWQLGTVAPGALVPGSAARVQRRFLDAILASFEATRD
ncbi:MAG: TetR/AcrR family transcriptional regulator [Myxococcota bacterium]